MKLFKCIWLFQFVVFSTFSQEKPLLSSINSYKVNDEGVAKFVTFKKSEALNFKNRVDVLKQFLEVSEGISFTKEDSKVDNIGMTHETYQQYYNGIPVEFGTYKVHSKDQVLSSINGDFYPIKEINTTPSISKLNAISKAKLHVNAEQYIKELEEVILVVLPKIEGINEANKLVYKVAIYAEKPFYRADVYVDAQTGDILFENKKIHQMDVPASGTTLYNGLQNFTAEQTGVNSYRLRQSTDGNEIQTFDAINGLGLANAEDIISSTTDFSANPIAAQAHWGTEQAYDYYDQKHGRNSYDDNGGIIKTYINFGNASSLANAYWSGSEMVFNDGNGDNTITHMVALDIIGHELTHGVVQHSAGLIYSYLPGAINESFADIFGEMIEKHAQQGTNDWLCGADVFVTNDAFRSMSDPKSKNHPDTYLGQYWETSSTDDFGVHINSGVQNKWFYLLSQGGAGTNDNSFNYSVTGIGTTKAAEIAYRNLTIYLTPNSNFFDARAGAIQSAIDLYGAGSTEVIATMDAWDAVGVGTTSSDVIPPTVPLNLGSSNFTEYAIDLTWDASTDNVGVVGYNIYKESSLIDVSSTPNYSSANLPYMPPNTVYNFTIAAFDAAGNISNTSNIESVWIDTIDPSNPANLTSNNTTETTTELSWELSTDNFTVTGYNIYEDNILLTTVPNSPYSLTNLTPSTTYNYTVTAVDDSGNESGISNLEPVTTLAPCAEGNVTLTIITDPFYPEETSWDIKDATNAVIASGGNYTVASTTHVYNITLGSGYYTLNMHDTVGDGFISPGGYVLESNVVIASGGYTGLLTNTVTTAFCIDAGSVLSSPSYDLTEDVKIITTSDYLQVVINGDLQLENYEVYSLTGAKLTNGISNKIPVEVLARGIYVLKLYFDKGAVSKKVIVY